MDIIFVVVKEKILNYTLINKKQKLEKIHFYLYHPISRNLPQRHQVPVTEHQH